MPSAFHGFCAVKVSFAFLASSVGRPGFTFKVPRGTALALAFAAFTFFDRLAAVAGTVDFALLLRAVPRDFFDRAAASACGVGSSSVLASRGADRGFATLAAPDFASDERRSFRSVLVLLFVAAPCWSPDGVEDPDFGPSAPREL
jgi:hypothetical protein